MNSIRAGLSALCGTVLLLAAGMVAAAEPVLSGFIEDPPPLLPDEQRKGAFIWRSPDFDVADFDQVMIEPILVWYAPDAKYKGINPDELKVLTDEFRKILVDALAPAHPVASKPGPRVLRARIAITNVNPQKKQWKWYQHTPIGLAATGVQQAAGKYHGVALKNAMFEAEFAGGEPPRRLGVLVEDLSGVDQDGDKQTTWGDVRRVFEEYGQRFRAAMDARHGK